MLAAKAVTRKVSDRMKPTRRVCVLYAFFFAVADQRVTLDMLQRYSAEHAITQPVQQLCRIDLAALSQYVTAGRAPRPDAGVHGR